MKKKLIILLTLALTFAAGWFAGEMNMSRTIGGIMTFQNDIELDRTARLAFDAYQNEKPEIGIYSLNELLEEIDNRKEVMTSEPDGATIGAYYVATHARLSKLYSTLQSEEKSAYHKSQAMEIASEYKALKKMFNEESFESGLARFDERQIP